MGNEKDRKLTKDEQERLNNCQKLSDELIAQGYERTDLTVDITKANIYAIVLGIPFMIPFFILFLINHKVSSFALNTVEVAILIIGVLVLTVVHELIHGFFWGINCKDHFKNIKFGFIAQYLTPYCTCLVPITKTQYLIGSLAPGIILGFGLSIISLFFSGSVLFYLGLIMIFAAGGDFTITLKLLFNKGNASTIYLDHPTACGLIAFSKK